MIKIDWNKDYRNEFACPKCGTIGMKLQGSDIQGKRTFKCFQCGRRTNQSYNLKKRKPVIDTMTDTILLRKQKIEGFICPECESKNIVFYNIEQGKKQFQCQICKKLTLDSIYLSHSNMSRYGHQEMMLKPFNFEDNTWDLRTINILLDRQSTRYIVNFSAINIHWLKLLVKQYIYHLCKINISWATIDHHMTSFRSFCHYLVENRIRSIDQINRNLILDFIIRQTTSNVVKQRLWTLRDFFCTGTLQGWFEIDQDIIRDEDYPNSSKGNPDPITDTVREQIENSLHKLPETIARMWIIAFFTAMRPNELALLKKDCLVQEAANWKIIWNRKKSKDRHEIPITRVIAKVVQEQQEYINTLWGDEWNYLFCHYQAISAKDPTQPKIKPVKKVIPATGSPLQKAICCLIQAEDIRDENGDLAKFSPSLVRPTRLTQLFEQGHDLAVVSAWAGHKRLVTTGLYYTKVSCELITKETEHIQKALFNADGKPLYYESLPKSFWENPIAHELNLPADHINTPIYGYCALPLDQRCDKFRACYTCSSFVPTPEKLPSYKKVRDELRGKESSARANGQNVLVEQFQRQADQLDKVIASLEGAA